MHVLLVDWDDRLSAAVVRSMAQRVGLHLVELHGIEQADELSAHLPAGWDGHGVLFYGGSSSIGQTGILAGLLDDLGRPLDLVLEAAMDPRPLEQRLLEARDRVIPLADQYQERGILRRVWSEGPPRALESALVYLLKDAVRAAQPEREALYPPEIESRVVTANRPEPPPESGQPASCPADDKADAGAEAQSGPAWRRSAEQKGRIKRGSSNGGRAGRGWKPRN